MILWKVSSSSNILSKKKRQRAEQKCREKRKERELRESEPKFRFQAYSCGDTLHPSCIFQHAAKSGGKQIFEAIIV
jgi:ribosomal protein S27E